MIVRWSSSGLLLLCLLLKGMEGRPSQTLVVTSSTTTTTPAPEAKSEDQEAPPRDPLLPPTISQFSVRSDIQFRYARTVVETYYKNPESQAQQVTFSLVLPDKAFVSNFSMLLAEEEYVARVETKEDARDDFEQAVHGGHGAGIVEQDARDANQIRVSANVEAGGKARFRLTYEELLQRRLQRYEHVVYVNPGQLVKDFRIDVFINESLPVTQVFVPELKEDPNAITSFKQNQDAVITRDPEDQSKVHIAYKPSLLRQKELNEATGVTGQFLVHYDVDRKREEGEVQVIDGYFVHFFAPDNLQTLPKHVVFVLDVSGSMYGEKLQQTKDAMVTVIDDLTEQDSFNILTFSDDVYHWTPKAELLKDGPHQLTYQGTEELRNEALKYVLDLQTIGGTNINQGILDALKKVKEVRQSETLAANTKPIIIFLTDGQATSGTTNKEEIKANVKSANGDHNVPIYSLAFGRGADFNLVKEISKENNAFARRIYEGSDAAIQLEDFYLEIASPLLDNLNIKYEGEYVNSSSLTSTRVRSFNKGNEIIIAGKLNDDLPSASNGDNNETAVEVFDVTISGTDKRGDYLQNFLICVPLPRPVPLPMPAVKPVHRVDDVVVETDELPRPIPIIEPMPIDPFVWPDRCLPLPPRPVEPRSDAQNFVERLWAFLTIKDLLDGKESELEEKKKELLEEEEPEQEQDSEGEEKDADADQDPEEEDVVDEFPAEKSERTNREKALELALRYNFVTELTSLVVTRPNSTEAEKEILEPVPVALGGHHPFGRSNHLMSQRVSSPMLQMAAAPPPASRGAPGPSFGMSSRRKVSGGRLSAKVRAPASRRPPPTRPSSLQPLMAMDYDYDDIFAESEMSSLPIPTTTPKTSCNGTLSLHDKTYLRGTNVTLSADEDDLVAVHGFGSRLTSLEARGDCCWQIFTGPCQEGDSKTFRPGVYNSASQMGVVFRAAASVQRLFEC